MAVGPAVAILIMLSGLPAAPATANSGVLVDCTALQPSIDPAINLRSINDCLANGDHRAALTPGTYPVNGGIVLPTGAQLTGDTTYPIIRLVANPHSTVRRR